MDVSLDYKESWTPKNWRFWTMVLEKTLESPSDCKEIQPVHSKENQSWIFVGRIIAEAETPILWSPMQKTDSLEKTMMLGRIEGRRRRVQQRFTWMASPTRWTWIWASSRNWWWTGKPGVLQSMGVTKSRTRLSDWTEPRGIWNHQLGHLHGTLW